MFRNIGPSCFLVLEVVQDDFVSEDILEKGVAKVEADASKTQ